MKNVFAPPRVPKTQRREAKVANAQLVLKATLWSLLAMKLLLAVELRANIFLIAPEGIFLGYACFALYTGSLWAQWYVAGSSYVSSVALLVYKDSGLLEIWGALVLFVGASLVSFHPGIAAYLRTERSQ